MTKYLFLLLCKLNRWTRHLQILSFAKTVERVNEQQCVLLIIWRKGLALNVTKHFIAAKKRSIEYDTVLKRFIAKCSRGAPYMYYYCTPEAVRPLRSGTGT